MQTGDEQNSTTRAKPASRPSGQWRSLAVMAVMVLIIYFLASSEMDAIKNFIRNHRGWGLGAAVILYGILGVTVMPSEPLTILLAGLFNPWVATLTATTGNTLAGLVEYFIGMKLSNAANFEQRKKSLPLGLGRLPVQSVTFLLVGRLVPGYGAKIVSLLAGAYHVPLFRYLWTTLIPTTIGAAIIAYGGKELADLFIRR